jgi:hypothetical protein
VLEWIQQNGVLSGIGAAIVAGVVALLVARSRRKNAGSTRTVQQTAGPGSAQATTAGGGDATASVGNRTGGDVDQGS